MSEWYEAQAQAKHWLLKGQDTNYAATATVPHDKQDEGARQRDSQDGITPALSGANTAGVAAGDRHDHLQVVTQEVPVGAAKRQLKAPRTATVSGNELGPFNWSCFSRCSMRTRRVLVFCWLGVSLGIITVQWIHDRLDDDNDATWQLVFAGAVHEIAYAANTASLIWYGSGAGGLAGLLRDRDVQPASLTVLNAGMLVSSVTSSAGTWALLLSLSLQASNRTAIGNSIFYAEWATHIVRLVSVFLPAAYLASVRRPIQRRCNELRLALRAVWPRVPVTNLDTVPDAQWTGSNVGGHDVVEVRILALTRDFQQCELPAGVKALIAINACSSVLSALDMWINVFGDSTPIAFLSQTMIATCTHIALGSLVTFVVHLQTLFLVGYLADEVEALQTIYRGWYVLYSELLGEQGTASGTGTSKSVRIHFKFKLDVNVCVRTCSLSKVDVEYLRRLSARGMSVGTVSIAAIGPPLIGLFNKYD